MRSSAIGIFFLFVLSAPLFAQEIAPEHDNIAVEKSTKLKPGTYEVPDADGNGVLHITKDGVTLDGKGAILRGSKMNAAPNTRTGAAIRLRNVKNVTLRNLTVYGYQFGIYAEGCENLTIENCNVSFTRAQKLKSRPEKEAIGGDFLALRNRQAWKSYGAGIWLEQCPGVKVSGCTGTDGQNGVLVVESDRSQITGNNFSFNSGWGIGLWETSDSHVMYNRADFCLRGSWWPNYAAGSDSAALVVVKKCHRNWFVANSLTHSGDGFFLTNIGGSKDPDTACNDNVIAFNDCSWAPANAYEATFSRRNAFIGNEGRACRYGYWNGYSSANLFVGNTIDDNLENGIAIEHGWDNVIEGNVFRRNGGAAVQLWHDPRRPHVDVWASRNNQILSNLFSQGMQAGIFLKYSENTVVRGNEFASNLFALELAAGVKNVKAHENTFRIEASKIKNLARGKKARFSIAKDHQDRTEQAKRTVNGVYFDEPGYEPGWSPDDFYEVDLGEKQRINLLLLHCRQISPYHFLFDYKVMGSPTGEFQGEEKLLLHVQNRTNKRIHDLTFPAAETRFLRIVCQEAQNWCGIVELEVFHAPDPKTFWEKYSCGNSVAYFPRRGGDEPAPDGINLEANFWQDAQGREPAALISDGPGVKTGEALEKAPKGKPVPNILTYPAGLHALRAGKGKEILKAMGPYLQKVECAISLKATLPKPDQKFQMYPEEGNLCGRRWLRAGEWLPERPKK